MTSYYGIVMILSSIGKECKPTLAFQVVVSHSRFIMHVSKHFYGTWNDKQITVNDTFPVEVWQGERFTQVRYTMLNKQGEPVIYQGVWLAVDGGYQKVACFINPMHNRFGFSEVVFSEWLESVRKDVECTFGILKIRFRFLRNPVIYQDAMTIENAFKTAAMLHNMLLQYDGLNVFHWDNIDPDGELGENEDVILVPVEHQPDIEVVALPTARQERLYVPYRTYNYELVREALKDHFNYQYQKGNVMTVV